MDTKKLFGGFVSEKVAENEARVARAQEAEARRIAQMELREQRRQPFIPVVERISKVIESVREVTSGAETIVIGEGYGTDNRFGKEFRRKVVVVMGKHPETELTPEHTVLCGLTLLNRRSETAYPDHADQVEFSFAIVPTEKVAHFIEDPHDLHNPRLDDVIRFEAEETTTVGHISRETNSAIGSEVEEYRQEKLRSLTELVESAEANWDIVNKTIGSKILNPHLHLTSSVIRDHGSEM